MTRELTPEEKKIINELTIKIINAVPIKEIDDWIRTFPDNMQVLIVESVDVMIKNLDKILKGSDQKELIAKLLKGEFHETNS
jgi:hypothetical protein